MSESTRDPNLICKCYHPLREHFSRRVTETKRFNLGKRTVYHAAYEGHCLMAGCDCRRFVWLYAESGGDYPGKCGI